MRAVFERRTGVFHPEDAWFEARSRAFWDDALTTQRFGSAARARLDPDAIAWATAFERCHRGIFSVAALENGTATIDDLWSGAELTVTLLDEAQALAFQHAEGAFDARVVAAPDASALFVLPGAFHHGADALEPAVHVLAVARERGMSTEAALDTLARMELVFRSSSRVKAAFAYRVETLSR